MVKFFFSTFAMAVLLLSCAKDRTTKGVNVRIENTTMETLDSVTVGSGYFGQLKPGHITNYLEIKDPIYTGYCNYKKDSVQVWAGMGICGTPMPPAFEKGFYTFKIENGGAGYNTVTVVKE